MLKDIVLKAHYCHANTLHCFGDKHFEFFAGVAERRHVQNKSLNLWNFLGRGCKNNLWAFK